MDLSNDIVWEELDFSPVQPVRTAVLTTSSSSFQLIRVKNARFIRLWSSLSNAFLPEGYPDSVTQDYFPFQLWDTLQGLSTYIRSMLSTQALLSGFGVGQSTATVMSATFQWFLRDFTGMLGGIIFTIHQGSNLDSKAKQWRLAADFMNDIGMILDLISPLFPKLFITLLCVGSIARSITGVASGATRAALTQHFALQQNAADISAKEGSQETAATLSGMLFGMVLARLTNGNIWSLWMCFLGLTAFHMFANYKAVQSLSLTSLNKERTEILCEAFLLKNKVLSPADVSTQELLLPSLKTLFSFQSLSRSAQKLTIIFGARISAVAITGRLSQQLTLYTQGYYFLVVEKEKIYIVLHKDSTREDYWKSYVHALVTLRYIEACGKDNPETLSCEWMENFYQEFVHKLKAAGWRTDRILMFPEKWRADWRKSV